MVDALAIEAEEGRVERRNASGSCNEHRSGDLRMRKRTCSKKQVS